MTTWSDLEKELNNWRAEGTTAGFWWRDDDAGALCKELVRLVELAETASVPLCLAVIPAKSTDRLADYLLPKIKAGQVDVVMHGFRHVSHAKEGEKKCEFPGHRLMHDILGDLAIGFEGLRMQYADRALPVFVPPWNRMDDSAVGRLPNASFKGLSRLGPRAAAHPVAGLKEVNSHLDIINWRGDRGFIGEEAAISLLLAHLRARRSGQADRQEPSGILTHHLDMDEAGWQFVEKLLHVVNNHTAASWLSATEIFGEAGP